MVGVFLVTSPAFTPSCSHPSRNALGLRLGEQASTGESGETFLKQEKGLSAKTGESLMDRRWCALATFQASMRRI